jgi:transcription initiation factor TFIIIB Brf1 subunit/transcription initiation factor TFIIB
MSHESFKATAMGKERDGYAAAMLYIVCLIKGVRPMRKRDVVARCTGVAESTIKKRAEEIVNILDIDPEYYFEKNYKRYVERHKNRFKKG